MEYSRALELELEWRISSTHSHVLLVSLAPFLGIVYRALVRLVMSESGHGKTTQGTTIDNTIYGSFEISRDFRLV